MLLTSLGEKLASIRIKTVNWLFLDEFTNFRRATISFVMSVRPSYRPHWKTCVHLDVFSWNLTFKYFFSKSCRQNSDDIKKWQEQRVIYMKTFLRLWHLAEFFWECEVVETGCRGSQITYFIFNNFFPPEIRASYDNVKKSGTARQATDDNMAWCMSTTLRITMATDLCGLVVRVSGYRYRGPGFDLRRYQIFWVVVGLERGPFSLVRSNWGATWIKKVAAPGSENRD